ncbi:MAG: cysteine desulfurase family protein [Planctomycetota bacterium]|nr:cysteine desulfurase family protein [Planctomycetota bacterium]
MSLIYLDNNATTLIHPDVSAVVSSTLAKQFANPASQHQAGRLARQNLESSRKTVSDCLGLSENDRFLFTSGGTEANNLAILGHFPCNESLVGKNIVASSLEHPSVQTALEFLESRGLEIRWVLPNALGVVEAADFIDRFDTHTKLACCTLANGDIGTIQPVDQIGQACCDSKIPFHVDAVQAVGKIEFDFPSLNCTSSSISAHKIHGPTSVGGLMLKHGLKIDPLFWGGFQQDGIRPGTESISCAAGLSKSLEIATVSLFSNTALVRSLRDEFEELVLSKINCAQINGFQANRLCNTTNISFLGVDRQQFVIAADLAHLACSTGSACSSGSSQPSPALASMNCPKEVTDSAVRFGFSSFNHRSDVFRAVDLIASIISKIKAPK